MCTVRPACHPRLPRHATPPPAGVAADSQWDAALNATDFPPQGVATHGRRPRNKNGIHNRWKKKKGTKKGPKDGRRGGPDSRKDGPPLITAGEAEGERSDRRGVMGGERA